MAYVDAQLLFSDGQAITTTASSTNIVDLLAGRNIGSGEELWIKGTVTTAMVGGTSLQAVVQASVDEAFTAPVDIASGPVVALANLGAGECFFLQRIPPTIPLGDPNYRYLRVNFVAVGTFTAGNVQAAILHNADTWQAFPKGYENAGDI